MLLLRLLFAAVPVIASRWQHVLGGIAAVTIPKDSLLGVCVITGFLGGFTTFSAFSWDLMQLVQGGEARLAFVFAIGTVTTCFAAAACGSWIGRSLL